VTVVSNNGGTQTVTANCATGNHAIGGGASSSQQTVMGSYPSLSNGNAVTTGSNPTSWTVRFNAAQGSNTAYVLCVPN
jgi:hypothetical protein